MKLWLKWYSGDRETCEVVRSCDGIFLLRFDRPYTCGNGEKIEMFAVGRHQEVDGFGGRLVQDDSRLLLFCTNGLRTSAIPWYQLFEADAEYCYRRLCEGEPLARRSLDIQAGYVVEVDVESAS